MQYWMETTNSHFEDRNFKGVRRCPHKFLKRYWAPSPIKRDNMNFKRVLLTNQNFVAK